MKEENKAIGQAVKKLIIDSGISQTEIATKLNINKSSLSQMLSGVAPLPVERFRKIAEIVKASPSEIERVNLLYLKREALKLVDEKNISSLLNATRQEITKRLTPDSDVQILTDITPPYSKMFPVIGEAAAAEVNTLAFPIAEWADKYSEERQYFPDGQPGDFAIRVSGNSMMPWYPPGTILLVRANQRIRQGERVIAIMEAGEVIFKIYAEKDNKFALLSIDDNGIDYLYPPRSPSEIRGLYRVISSVRNEEKLDFAMRQAGIHHRWEQKLKEL